MAIIDVDIDSAKTGVQSYKAGNQEMATSFSGLGGSVPKSSYIETKYFSELETFVSNMTTKNITIADAALYYLDGLKEFEGSMKYTPGQISKFPGVGSANRGGGGVSDSNGSSSTDDTGGDVNGETSGVEGSEKSSSTDDTGGDVKGKKDKVDDSEKSSSTDDTGGDVKGEKDDVDDSDKTSSTDDTGGDVKGKKDKVDGAGGRSGRASTGGGLGSAGSVDSAEGQSKGAETGSNIDINDGSVDAALTADEAEQLLNELLTNNNGIDAALGSSTAAGLKELLTGGNKDVAKGGLGLGALAAIIGTIAAGGAGVAGAIGSSASKGSSGGGLSDKNASLGVQSMKSGIVAGGSGGYSMSELLGGNYPEPLAKGMNALDMVMNIVNESGNMTNSEFEFAMTGEPYAFKDLTFAQKEGMFLQLGTLFDKYGGVEGFLESSGAHAFLESCADAYDAIKNLQGKSPEEICNAMRGLLDQSSPNIGGIPISREVRDFIINYLQQATGLPIQELLNGSHNAELSAAINDLLGVLNVFKVLAGLSKEELRKYIYDMMKGKFPELCGINPFSVRTFKDYMIGFAGRNGCTYLELYTVPARSESLRACIKEYATAKQMLAALDSARDINIQEILARLARGEMVNVHGMTITGMTKFALSSLLKVLSLYYKCSINDLLSQAQYGDKLKFYVHSLYKYAVFQGMFATLKVETLFANVNDMMKGNNFGLLGFNYLEIESIKKACEEHANRHNIKVNDLYTNTSYAPRFREFLVNNDTFIKVTLIFDGLNDTDTQILIHNLMVAWDIDFRERLQNLLNYANKKRLQTLIGSASEDTRNKIRIVSEKILEDDLQKVLSVPDEGLYNGLAELYATGKFKPEIGVELSYVLRLYLLILAISQKLSVKDLLAHPDGKLLVKETLQFVKFIPGKLSNSGDLFEFDRLSEFMGRILMGCYPDLLGYTEDKYKAITDLYYNLAAKKGVNVKEYLSNLSYAKEIATIVDGDQNNRVVAIFARELNEQMTQRFINTFLFGAIRK